MTISVIIPALNEEDSLPWVLQALPWQALEEVLVVDGGSSDRTAALAQAAGARVVLETRRGYGRACASGAQQARGEVLVFLDADGADDPRRVLDLARQVASGQADLALGSRLAGQVQPGAMPWHQRAGNWLCAALITTLYGCHLTDLSPFRAVCRQRLVELDLREMTYGYPTEMIVKALRRGWRLAELPVGYRPRLGGRSKISGTFKGSVLATVYILKMILQHAWGKS
jgi:glycosyltransferase involved in cell wall biosynthesis